jgi:hypothetical protein
LRSCDNDSGFKEEYRCISVSRDGTIRVWDLNPLLEGETYVMQRWTSCLIANKVPQRGWTAYGSWIKNEEGNYLFFVPLHRPFRHPLNTLVIGQCPELDMTHFVYGEEWVNCREPTHAIDDERKAAALAPEPEFEGLNCKCN